MVGEFGIQCLEKKNGNNNTGEMLGKEQCKRTSGTSHCVNSCCSNQLDHSRESG